MGGVAGGAKRLRGGGDGRVLAEIRTRDDRVVSPPEMVGSPAKSLVGNY